MFFFARLMSSVKHARVHSDLAVVSIYTHRVCVYVCVQRVFIAAGMLHALPFTKRNSVESPSDTKTSASLYYASAEMERRSGEGSHVSL